MASKADIVTTLGPASSNTEAFFKMVESGADIARLNFAWGSYEEKAAQIEVVRAAEKRFGKRIPIIADLPGPRTQHVRGHTYTKDIPVTTEMDIEHMKFCVKHGVELIALSFIGSAKDVEGARAALKNVGGTQPLIAKIERKAALDNIEAVIKAADAIMVARGDLVSEIPIETLPFAQKRIIEAANAAKKPVITATEMLLSMKDNPLPTRAEVTDVANAILQGSDAVMLSEETSVGKHPSEAVAMMEKITLEAEKHIARSIIPVASLV
ncbi:MAG TPA: pyruvate kinase [Candidatus Paceibacterota bacterium]|nr:pyruvate kinase [Candidatus Paceibacterota bacterium]